MARFEDVFRKALKDLRDAGAKFAVVGALAVSVRTEIRFTRDIDLAVAVESDQDAQALVRALFASGYRLIAQVEQEAVGRLATARLAPSDLPEEPGVDLLFASSGIEPEIVRAAEPLAILPELIAPTAVVEHLLALKVLSVNERRPQDQADILALLKEAKPGQVEAARSALSLIGERGYNRNQDLQAKLERFLKLHRKPDVSM